MGYMGLKHFEESDLAFDLVSEIVTSKKKVLAKGLKEKGNNFNTEGCVNVALYAEAFILPLISNKYVVRSLVDLYEPLAKAEFGLHSLISDLENCSPSEVGGSKNKSFHLKNYRRMQENINKILKKLEAI